MPSKVGIGRVRVSGGKLRGRYIKTQPSSELRPTTERVREAIFSSLESRDHLDGAVVLDLYSGSGILSLEALSRGAVRAVAVEHDRQRSRLLQENSVALGLEQQLEVHSVTVERYIANSLLDEFSLIFADPPYADAAPITLLEQLLVTGALASKLTFVFEGPRLLNDSELNSIKALLQGFAYTAAEIWQKRYGTSSIIAGCLMRIEVGTNAAE